MAAETVVPHNILFRMAGPDLQPVSLPVQTPTGHRIMTSELQELKRKSAIATAYVHPRHNELFLKPLEPLIQSTAVLADDLILQIYDQDWDVLLYKEYPHLYVILDNPRSSVFQKAVAYLSQQLTLTFVFDGREEHRKANTAPDKPQSRFRVDCILVSTAHFVFLFDGKNLGSQVVLDVVRPWLVSSGIHKVVHRFADHDVFLKKYYQIEVQNYYDVADAEDRLERQLNLVSLGSYSIRGFRSRYRNRSFVFDNFPDADFNYRPLSQVTEKVPSRLREISQNDQKVFLDCIKQILYLDIIRKCQMDLFLARAIDSTEKALRKIYSYDVEGSFAAGWELDAQGRGIQRSPEQELANESDDE